MGAFGHFTAVQCQSKLPQQSGPPAEICSDVHNRSGVWHCQKVAVRVDMIVKRSSNAHIELIVATAQSAAFLPTDCTRPPTETQPMARLPRPAPRTNHSHIPTSPDITPVPLAPGAWACSCDPSHTTPKICWLYTSAHCPTLASRRGGQRRPYNACFCTRPSAAAMLAWSDSSRSAEAPVRPYVSVTRGTKSTPSPAVLLATFKAAQICWIVLHHVVMSNCTITHIQPFCKGYSQQLKEFNGCDITSARYVGMISSLPKQLRIRE